MTNSAVVTNRVQHRRGADNVSLMVQARPTFAQFMQASMSITPTELRAARIDPAHGRVGCVLSDPYSAVLMVQKATAHLGSSTDRFTGSYHSRFQNTARLLRCRPALTEDALRVPLTMVSHANWLTMRALGFSWVQAEAFGELQARRAIRGETTHAHRMELFPEGLKAFSNTKRSGSSWDWREFPDGVKRYAWETPHFDRVNFFR